MNIAFLGYKDSFNYNHVGGTDSLVRRIALALADQGDTVDLVLYGGNERSRDTIGHGVTQSTFTDLGQACNHLKATSDHVVSIYLKPADRLHYARFRKGVAGGLVFHHFYSTWNESFAKRQLLFAEARIWPFNGCLFCLSPRLLRKVRRWARRSVLLFPPVSCGYFQSLESRQRNQRFRIAYAGRLDAAKGADVAIEALRKLAVEPDYELHVHGFAWSHDAAGMALHESLLRDPAVHYQPASQRQWTPQTDIELARQLSNTDIVLLPYRRLSSTIDIPLLLLEAMASLCAVVTPGLGDLHEVYGESLFNLPRNWSRDTLVDIVARAGACLSDERRRLSDRNTSLGFDTSQIAAKFRRAMSEDN